MDNLFDKITFEGDSNSTYKIWDSDAARKISEFTTAERRQNIMSGDGYNTIYSKLSKWYEDFKPIVWTGSYNDLMDRPTIPVVKNGILEIQKNGTLVASFGANSALNVIANIIVPEINDNISSPTSLYSSQKIDKLITDLGMNIVDGGDSDPIEIPTDVISQITDTIINKIESGEIDIPSGGESVDYNQIYDYINRNLPTVNNGRLNITINGIAALTQNGNILPDGSNYFSANQAESYDLDIIIPDVTTFIDDSTEANNKTWSSQKIRQEIITNGSLKMVVLGDDSDLPDSGEANTIYFKRATDSEEGDNKYYEWVWVNDSWENIGRQVIDLSDYALKSEIGDAALSIIQQSGTTTFSANDTNPKEVTIPQPDWSQTSATANDYIKNKPDFQLKIAGNEGEVIYHNGIDVFAQTIMNEGCVVTTAEDLAKCENNSPSFESVFNTWKRFSHKGSVDDYQRGTAGSDYDSWTYIPESDTVNQPNNSTAYTGFISAKSYTNYDIKVRVYSNDSDDDFIGMVAAFAKDSNGKEHTLSFLRTTNGTGINFTGCGWVCMLDFRGQSSKNEIGVNGLQILANKNSVMQIKDTTWADVNNDGASTGGTVISMVRTGNVITAKCSEFGTSELVSESTITIDLDDATLTSQYPTLNLFKGSAPWGYSTYSQRNSRYENISITDPDNTIYDFVNNKILQYNSQNQQWEERQGESPYTALGLGRFSFNSITEKLFYNTGEKIIQIPTQIQSDWTQNDSTSKDFIKNKPAIPDAQVNSDWNSNSGASQILNKPTLGTAASKDVAASGNASASQVVMGNDTRLTDARTPVSHQHTISEITDFPTIPDAQIQADWNQTDDEAADYIKNKPSFAGIKVVDASALTNGTLQTNANVNDLVVLANASSSVTYTYTNNAGTEKHLKGNPNYDIVFRYCGNNRFQPITLPIPLD